MNKEELLEELKEKVASKEISESEVARVLDHKLDNHSKHFEINKLLYIIGAAVVSIGILVFVSQIWQDIGSASRILLTLGMGLLLAAIGSYLFIKEPLNSGIGSVFHFIGALLIPAGIFVTLDELGIQPSFDETLIYAVISSILFLFYTLLAIQHRKAVLTFFAVVNGSTALYLTLVTIIENVYPRLDYQVTEKINLYFIFLLGASYLLLSIDFKKNWNKPLVGISNFFGGMYLLFAGFQLAIDSSAWLIGYFLLLGLGFYISIYLKSKVILIESTIALISILFYITSEYFADSLGWPISLILLGFAFIGIGYFSVNFGRKYLNK